MPLTFVPYKFVKIIHLIFQLISHGESKNIMLEFEMKKVDITYKLHSNQPMEVTPH